MADTAWTFSAVLGQDEAIGLFHREAAAERFSHAYLFEGAAGTGRLTFAKALAGLALCTKPVGGNACGTCRSCLLLQHGEHPDYLELPREPAELRIGRFVERLTASTETVDHQPLLPFLRFRPVEGKRRVAVVPDSERMRPESANAFLKTLEEPPGDALLLLTTNSRDRLPATVVSRCRRVVVKPLDTDTLAKQLEGRGLAQGQDAFDLALTAEGSLGAALALADGETLELWRWLDKEAFSKPGASSARDLADRLLAYASASDNAGKRKGAIAALDLTALAVRRMLRSGLPGGKGESALAILWEAGDQILRNVKPDLVVLSAAFDVMAAIR